MLDFLKRYKQDNTEAIQAEIIGKVQRAAGHFIQTAAPIPAELDYSVESLRIVDDILAQVREGAYTLTPPQRLGAAAYVYEVARGRYGGLYEVCDDDDPIVLVTGEPEFEVCLCAISKVEDLTRGRSGDGLAEFFDRYARGVQVRSAEIIR